MDLVLWRHAEAEDAREGQDDMDRVLTRRGEKQAARMALWLNRQLAADARVLASPAKRTEQTVKALGRGFKLRSELAPMASAAELLRAVGWPEEGATVLVVGHQPTMGQVVAQLLGLRESDCSVKKGSVWWLRSRQRGADGQTILVTVQTPDML